MEKQALAREAGRRLREAIDEAAREQLENLRIAADNRQARLTGQGEIRPYQKAAFSRMIKIADAVVDLAGQ